MSSFKRWLPLSREINDDPEVWELTDQFGDRSLRTWIEVLACLDRTENCWRLTGQWLAGLSRRTRQKPASIQRQLGWMLAKDWLVASELLADGSPAVYSSPKYWKYRKKRYAKDETVGTEPEPTIAPPYPIKHKIRKQNPVGGFVGGFESTVRRDAGFESTADIMKETEFFARNPHLREGS